MFTEKKELANKATTDISLAQEYGPAVYAVPVAWLSGLLLGIMIMLGWS